MGSIGALGPALMRIVGMGRRGSARSPRRRTRTRFAVASVALVLAGIAGCLLLLRDPTARILDRRGLLESALEGELVRDSGHVDQEVRLVSTSGLEVQLAIRRPDDGAAIPRALVLILGGHDTGRAAARLFPDTHGLVVAAVSYPTSVTRIRKIADFFDVRDAILDTPSALMLSLDYLCARSYADPARVELVGVSLGAPFACVAGSLDDRVRRVWAIHGGGSPSRLLAHSLHDDLPAPLCGLAGYALAFVAHGMTLAPEDWVARIAPRSFVMINGLDDERIPRACVDLLYAAAHEPKELVWIPGGHIDKHDETRMRELCDMVVAAVDEPEIPGQAR